MVCTAKTTYKVGDKVRILNAKKIEACDAKDGDILEVIDVDYEDAPVLNDVDGGPLYMLTSELKYIEKVEEQVAKFKVGDKVKVIADDEFVAKGTVLTIKRGPEGDGMGGNYYFEENGGIILGDDLQLISQKPTKNQRITTLEQEVEALKAEVEALKAAQSIGKTAEAIVKVIEKHTPKSPNEQRKATIAEAKAFVETKTHYLQDSAKVKGGWTSKQRENLTFCDYLTKAEFIVNAEKRTVVALIRYEHGNEVKAKATAKYAPTDVFNVDIGKAIALGRALGLDVKRFEQAVQPSEVAVGQTIKYTDNLWLTGKTRDINEVTDVSIGFTDGKRFSAIKKPHINDYIGNAFVITDDTEAKY